MNWTPKKGVGKTLYAIDTWNYNFNSSTPYGAWTSDIYCPTIVKYIDVLIITNGVTKGSTFIVAKKKCDSITNKKKGGTEYKTYDAAMKGAEQYLINLQTNIAANANYQYNWAQIEVERLKRIIRESESQYKHLIERIKTL